MYQFSGTGSLRNHSFFSFHGYLQLLIDLSEPCKLGQMPLNRPDVSLWIRREIICPFSDEAVCNKMFIASSSSSVFANIFFLSKAQGNCALKYIKKRKKGELCVNILR